MGGGVGTRSANTYIDYHNIGFQGRVDGLGFGVLRVWGFQGYWDSGKDKGNYDLGVLLGLSRGAI